MLKFSNTRLKCFYKGVIGMMFAWYCKKVFWAVVISYAVKVMTNLIAFQRPPQLLFQDEAMFIYTLPRDISNDITFRSLISPPSPLGMLISFGSVTPLWVFLASNFHCFRRCSIGQTTFAEYSADASATTTWGIAKVQTYFSKVKFFIPMKSQQFIIRNGFVNFSYALQIHTLSIYDTVHTCQV